VRLVSIVCRKEILDNLRDRRTMFSTLVFGPLFAPILFTVMIQLTVSRAVSSAEETLEIPMLGIEQADNLRAFLGARRIEPAAEAGVADLASAADAVRAGRQGVVLVVEDDFEKGLTDGAGGRITLVFDRSNSRDSSRAQRVQGALRAYSDQIAALRLLARGIDPTLLRPLIVDSYDVSTPAGRSALLLGVLTYFLLFATLMGGMYLAIDTTAGERERKSLEPLLATPVPRSALLLGKVSATVVFMLLSLALTLAGFTVALSQLPLDELGMSSGFDVQTALVSFLVLAPFAPLGAVLLTLVASFTRSYKEAQTYLGLLLLVPTLPVIVASVLNVEPRPALMWVPSMSQHLLVTSLIKQEPMEWLMVAQSVLSTLLLTVLLTFVAIRLYKREGLLG
jgi:sodium transport system permease protein